MELSTMVANNEFGKITPARMDNKIRKTTTPATINVFTFSAFDFDFIKFIHYLLLVPLGYGYNLCIVVIRAVRPYLRRHNPDFIRLDIGFNHFKCVDHLITLNR